MPKDPHITGGIRHDWAAIKHEYVTDPNASLRKIAKKYGVSLNTIAKKSKAEDWFATRKKTQTKVVTKGITKTTNKMADELSKESDFLERMKGHMDRMLQDDMQFQRHLIETRVVDEDGSMIVSPEEKIFNKFDSRSMKDAMQTLKLIEEMTRSLYNLQKAETIQKHQIEAERLALDREKFEWEKQKSAAFKPTEGNVIRIEGFEEGWAK